MTVTPAAVPAIAAPRVEPEAAVELVGLVQGQVARLVAERECGGNVQPNVAYQLAGALESLLKDLRGDAPVRRWLGLDASAVAYVRHAVRVGRRLDMTRAFDRLNPGFGVPAEHGCWDTTAEQRQRRAAMRRREVELSMGERFARMLPPAEGCEAA